MIKENQEVLFNYVAEPYHFLDHKMPVFIDNIECFAKLWTKELEWRITFEYADFYDEPRFTTVRVEWHSSTIYYSTDKSLTVDQLIDEVFSPEHFNGMMPVVFKSKVNSFRIDDDYLLSTKCDWKIKLPLAMCYFALPPIEAVIDSLSKYISESNGKFAPIDGSDIQSLTDLYDFYSLLIYWPVDKEEWQWLIKHHTSFKHVNSCVDPLYGETLIID